MRLTRTLLAAVLTAAASLSVGLPSAMAAPPSNDTAAGATAVSLGFGELLDTTEATTDADDALGCPVLGPIDASVWYAYTAPVDGYVAIDASASSYFTGLGVATGSPGSLTVQSCGLFTISSFAATAGTTYYIQAFDASGDGVTGGLLSISIDEAAPPPTLDVAVDPTGFVNAKTGVATITGTITCTDANSALIGVSLTQPVGKRATVSGFGGFSGESICDGTPQPWSADILPVGGRFVGGKSASVAFSFACGSAQCALGSAEQTVKLNGGKR